MKNDNICFITTVFCLILMIGSLMVSAIAIEKANVAMLEAKRQRVQVQQIRDKFWCDTGWKI